MKHFEGYETLNKQEQEFIPCLEAVSDDSIWGLAISVAMKNPTAQTIRRLISDLKNQESDAPEIMLSILGQSCYDQLLNL